MKSFWQDLRYGARMLAKHPGFTQTEPATLARQLENAWPQSNADWGAYLVPLAEQHSSKVRRALLVLQGAVGFVLLITCVNLANLLLDTGTAGDESRPDDCTQARIA